MNYIKSKPLSRRFLLKGIGASMTLPMMEAMAITKKGESSNQLASGPDGQPVRYAAIFMPNGALPGSFAPEGSTLDKLTRTLSPLGDMAQHCNVISGLSTGMGGHTASTAGFLTGQKPTADKASGSINVFNASIDQIIGEAAKGTCPLPTLELALHTPRRGTSPSGLPWTLGNFISYRNATTPVPQELNPMSAFLRLFEHASLTSSPSKSKKKKPFQPSASVVDAVLDDAKRLQKKLGKADNQKLDEYLTTVRDVESRIISASKQQAKGVKITKEILADINSTESKLKDHVKKSQLSAKPKLPYPVYIELMMDVLSLALWSNSTRACTLMLGDGGSRTNMSFLDGVSGAHHSISHHGNNPAKQEQYILINKFFIEKYTYLLKRLDGVKEGGSSVLENSMIMCGSGISNGQNHSKGNIPLIMAGSAGGRIKTNRHIKAPNRTSVGSLHKSVLDIMNIKGDYIRGKGGALKDI